MSYVSFSGDGGQVDQLLAWQGVQRAQDIFSGHFSYLFKYLFSALLT